MGTINIERTVYEVSKSAYGTRSTLTVVLKNSIPLPNDFKTNVKFYDENMNVVAEQTKTGLLLPLGDVELTFSVDSSSVMADIVVTRMLLPLIQEDKKTVYPG